MVITILIIAKKYLTYLIIVIATQLSLVHQVIAEVILAGGKR